MYTGPTASRLSSVIAAPVTSSRVKSDACSYSVFSAAKEDRLRTEEPAKAVQVSSFLLEPS